MSELSARKKPLGIILIAVYTGFGAFLALAGGVPSMLAGRLVLGAAFLSIVLIGYGVLAAATTYGVWTLEKWGYELAKILYIIAIPFGVVALVLDRSAGNVLMQLVGIAVAAKILVYLFKPETEAVFRQS